MSTTASGRTSSLRSDNKNIFAAWCKGTLENFNFTSPRRVTLGGEEGRDGFVCRPPRGKMHRIFVPSSTHGRADMKSFRHKWLFLSIRGDFVHLSERVRKRLAAESITDAACVDYRFTPKLLQTCSKVDTDLS